MARARLFVLFVLLAGACVPAVAATCGNGVQPAGASLGLFRPGTSGAVPVGPGGRDEVCLGPSFTGSLLDGSDPPAGVGYGYLVQGRNACGQGSWGDARVTTRCP